MDIFEMLDELEDIIESSSKIPLTNKFVINGDELYDVIDKIRSAIPEEIKEARWIIDEKEKLFKEAQNHVENMIKQTKQQTCRLADDTEITKKAKEKADEILRKAKAVSHEIKNGADAYADDILAQIEKNLLQVAGTIRENRNELRNSKEAATTNE